jgi:large conductance mechanosensitive channel
MFKSSVLLLGDSLERQMNLKGLLAEFKAFAFKGNMIELAVAVVIGAAFSTVINSLVNDVIMPTVGYAVNTATTAAEKAKDVAVHTMADAATKAGISTSQSATAPSTQTAQAAAAPPSTTAVAPAAPAVPQGATPTPTAPVQIHLMIGPVNAGAFIGSLLNFLLVAGAVFLVIVKLLGSVMKKVSKPAAPSEPTTRECPECLSLISVKAKRCPACTSTIVPIVA